MKGGRKYTYKEFRAFLAKKRSNKELLVFIKTSRNNTYRNTVNMLDEMVAGNIKKYSLIDITEAEEDYLSTLK